MLIRYVLKPFPGNTVQITYTTKYKMSDYVIIQN